MGGKVMYNIMRKDFGVNTPRKVNISLNDAKLVNIFKIVKFIKKYNGYEYNLQDTEKYVRLVGGEVGNRVEEDEYKDSDFDIIRYMNYSFHSLEIFKATNQHSEYRYIVVNMKSTFEGKTDGKASYLRSNNKGFLFYNADSLYTVGKIRESVEGKYLSKDKAIENIEENKGTITASSNQIYNYVYSALFTNMPKKKQEYSMSHKVYTEVVGAIFDYLIYAYNLEINFKRMEDYLKENSSDYAKVFKTKKNINKKVLEEMKQSPFLKYFRYVELDNDTDILKYRGVFTEWEKVSKVLPNVKGLELRFRKLGQLRAVGVFFPTYKCISLDIRDVSAFIHEYAHAIDFSQKDVLSLQKDFSKIVDEYSRNYDNLVDRSGNPDYYKRKGGYFKSTTEIFARGLEYYLLLKGVKTPLNVTKEGLKELPYVSFSGMNDNIVEYYRNNVKI